MVFCGKQSKYNIGDKVHLIKEDRDGVVTNIGILGGKLSNWKFLYTIDNNEQYIEEGL